jgi:pimeloyl-ACP methyl ester carboxylesterase
MSKPTLKPPKLKLALGELQRAYESAATMNDQALRDLFPYGDGTPVMVIPGFGADDLSTKSLGEFVSSLGYAGKKWKGGNHLGPSDYTRQHFIDRLEHVYAKHGNRPVTLIGWSLGGIMSREIARERPELVAQVITMGSPHLAPIYPESSLLEKPLKLATEFHQAVGNAKSVIQDLPNLAMFYINPKNTLCDKFKVAMVYPLISTQRLFKRSDALADESFALQAAEPINVPCTHIYSQNDGVVNWQTCLGEEGLTTQNIEVETSHLGLGFDFAVRLILADRLHHNANASQENWRAFKAEDYAELQDFPDVMAHEKVTPLPRPSGLKK